jgi:hypothetical protein
MKYDASEEYLFECLILTDGLNAKNIEETLKESLLEMIKEKKVSKAFMTNECQSKKNKTFKLFSVLEELQCLKSGKIVDIRRIPQEWKEELKKEMEDKEELDEKRLLNLDECIILCVEKDNKVKAVVMNRKGIYSISSKPPQ